MILDTNAISALLDGDKALESLLDILEAESVPLALDSASAR